jgi:hypothetical protein
MSAHRRPEKEVQVMFEVYPSSWPMAVDATDPRNQFHERALHEARATTDYREPASQVSSRTGLVTRLRLAIAGGPAISASEPCNCPA